MKIATGINVRAKGAKHYVFLNHAGLRSVGQRGSQSKVDSPVHQAAEGTGSIPL
jgi:hypothetical protein